MSYEVKQPNIWGRIGAGLGQGMAETIPKEIERYRLAEGLKNLSQKKGLSITEQMAELMAVPGITPQMIQSYGELLKLQRQGEAYGKGSGQQGLVTSGGMTRQMSPQSQISGQEQLDLIKRANPEIAQGEYPGLVKAEQTGQPQIVPENPTREEFLSKFPWTPEMRDERISHYISRNFLPEEAKQLAADDEKRYLENPQVYQKRLQEREATKVKLRDEFDRQLTQKLEKSGKDILNDISGENLSRLERTMERDLILNPQKSIADIASEGSERALNLAKAKSNLRELTGTVGIIEGVLRGQNVEDKLKAIQNAYAETGNQEEFYNTLISDLGLSRQRAAQLAYPKSKKVSSFISNYKPIKVDNLQNSEKISRATAIEIGEFLSPNDSIQAIAYELRKKDPLFNDAVFFNELVNNMDEIGLTPRQKRELQQGPAPFVKSWADFFYLPK